MECIENELHALQHSALPSPHSNLQRSLHLRNGEACLCHIQAAAGTVPAVASLQDISIASPSTPALLDCSPTRTFSEERCQGATQSKAQCGRAAVEAAARCMLAAGRCRVVCHQGTVWDSFRARRGHAFEENPRKPQCDFPVAHHPQMVHIFCLSWW